jgi:hypothetical protein
MLEGDMALAAEAGAALSCILLGDEDDDDGSIKIPRSCCCCCCLLALLATATLASAALLGLRQGLPNAISFSVARLRCSILYSIILQLFDLNKVPDYRIIVHRDELSCEKQLALRCTSYEASPKYE